MSPNESDTRDAIGWDWPPIRFTLRSNDADLLRRGSALFRPAPAVVKPAATAARQLIEYSCIRSRESGAPPWRVRLPGAVAGIAVESAGRALWEVEFHALQELLRSPGTLPGIHAALLSREGRGIAIAGPYESGKSTLACALWKNGWSLHCDDAVLLDSERGVAHSTPRRVSLRHGSRALFGDAFWSRLQATPSCIETAKGIMFLPREVGGPLDAGPVRLGGIVFLARQGAVTGPAELRPIEPAHALMALLPYSNGRERFGTAEAIRQLQPISEGVAAYDLGRGPIPAMVERIEALREGATWPR